MRREFVAHARVEPPWRQKSRAPQASHLHAEPSATSPLLCRFRLGQQHHHDWLWCGAERQGRPLRKESQQSVRRRRPSLAQASGRVAERDSDAVANPHQEFRGLDGNRLQRFLRLRACTSDKRRRTRGVARPGGPALASHQAMQLRDSAWNERVHCRRRERPQRLLHVSPAGVEVFLADPHITIDVSWRGWRYG